MKYTYYRTYVHPYNPVSLPATFSDIRNEVEKDMCDFFNMDPEAAWTLLDVTAETTHTHDHGMRTRVTVVYEPGKANLNIKGGRSIYPPF